MAFYDTTILDNSTNFYDLAVNISNLTGYDYLIGNMILLTFFIIFLVLAYKYDFLEVFIADSFITTILAILLYGAVLVPATSIVYPFVILMISLIFYMVAK